VKKIILLWTILAYISFSGAFAAEVMDEKQYAPPPVSRSPEPARPGTVIVSPDRGEDEVIIVVPTPPNQESPGAVVPGIPAIPEPPLAPAPADVIVLPDTRREEAVVIPPHKYRSDEDKKPEDAGPARPEKMPEKTILTPKDFLPLTPEKKTPETGEDKKKSPPLTTTPPQKEQTGEKKQSPRKGEPLKIPEEAAKNGKLDFLEGCWVGTRPEYGTKRIVRERFCFDKNGIGKRYIYDPGYAGECVGATRALINSGGVLRMNSDKMFCASGDIWGASEMTCRGEGEQTPCSWVFRDINNARQSYKIQFVRE
jgi:hypothetical protein